MPAARIAGNVALSLATKLTSGYWHLFDSQCGYTAASRRALAVDRRGRAVPALRLSERSAGAAARGADCASCDVPVRAIYGAHWRSGIRLSTVVYPMSFVLLRSWLRRLVAKRAAPIEVGAGGGGAAGGGGVECASAS